MLHRDPNLRPSTEDCLNVNSCILILYSINGFSVTEKHCKTLFGWTDSLLISERTIDNCMTIFCNCQSSNRLYTLPITTDQIRTQFLKWNPCMMLKYLQVTLRVKEVFQLMLITLTSRFVTTKLCKMRECQILQLIRSGMLGLLVLASAIT